VKGFLKVVDIYKEFSVVFTTGYIVVFVFGLVYDFIKWIFGRAVAYQGRRRQAKDYANQGDRFLCPVCFNLNDDNFPVIMPDGRSLDGGCMECWLKTTATPQSPNFSRAPRPVQAPRHRPVKEIYSPLPDPTDYTGSILHMAEIHRQKKGGQN
jgi:hypothetical protein